MLKKGVPSKWDEEQAQTVKELKVALAQAPALAYPRQGLPFVLQLATTETGIGAVLLQDHGMGLRPVAYASWTLNNTEQQFTP